ncbi:PLAC8 family protein isoform X2 [Tasmannia lanceolata]|uniref:PLAC8 family protein isoform X2 n=1 Tax=Tasmannia lanceolata TaxID=3420 RepID=UPI004064BBDC
MGRIKNTEHGELVQPPEPLGDLTESVGNLPESIRSPPESGHADTSGPQSQASDLQEDEIPVPFPPTKPLGNMGPPRTEPAYAVPVNPPVVTTSVIGYPWTTGLFDCHEHQTNGCPLGSLIYILMAPALCSQWIMGSMYRARLRRAYNLVEAPTQDWVAHAFCPCCSLCQEFRELRNRGLDPSLGWLGHLAQLQGRDQQYQAQQATAPPLNQSMSK